MLLLGPGCLVGEGLPWLGAPSSALSVSQGLPQRPAACAWLHSLPRAMALSTLAVWEWGKGKLQKIELKLEF